MSHPTARAAASGHDGDGSQPSLDDLRHLEAFDRLGSAEAAGRDLGVAASTVYRRIAALETSLGVACLSRGAGLSEAGRELAAVARGADAQLQAVLRRARATAAEVRGTVSLTTVDAFSPLLSGPLATLSHTHPELRIDLHISDRGLSVKRREADLALSIVPQPPAQLVGRKLATVRYGVFGTPSVVDASSPRWVVLGPPAHHSAEADWERQRVASDQIAVATGSRRTFLDLVISGAGLGLLPRPLAALHPELVELTQYRSSLSELRRPAWLLTHAEQKDHARISVVMKLLGDQLSQILKSQLLKSQVLKR